MHEYFKENNTCCLTLLPSLLKKKDLLKDDIFFMIKLFNKVPKALNLCLLSRQKMSDYRIYKELSSEIYEAIDELKSSGYTICEMNADEFWGSTIFGVSRIEAHQLLTSNILTVANILQPAVRSALEMPDFFLYLQTNGVIHPKVTRQYLHEHIDAHTINMNVIDQYIAYDLLENCVHQNQASHPAVLQALAYCQDTTLYLWEYDDQKALVPYCRPEGNFEVFVSNSNAANRIDLLYYDPNDHYNFKQVKFKGYTDSLPTNFSLPIPPFSPVSEIHVPDSYKIGNNIHNDCRLIHWIIDYLLLKSKDEFYDAGFDQQASLIFNLRNENNQLRRRNSELLDTLGERDLMSEQTLLRGSTPYYSSYSTSSQSVESSSSVNSRGIALVNTGM